MTDESRKPSKKDCARARAVAIKALQQGQRYAVFKGEKDIYQIAFVRDDKHPTPFSVLWGPFGFRCVFSAAASC